MTTHEPSRPIATTHVGATIDYLKGAGLRYELLEHDPVMSAAAEASATHIPPAQVAKTVVLHDGSGYVLAVISAADRLAVHKLRALLAASHTLTFADEDAIARDFPAFDVGAMPPFGSMVPAAEVIDRALLQHDRVLCIAGDHRHSVLVDPREIVRVAAARTADIHQD